MSNDNIQQLKNMINNGFDIDMIIEDQHTPLTLAVFKNISEVVKFLVKEGADVNKFDLDGFVPLDEAINNQNIEMVEFLVDNGSDINIIHPYNLCTEGALLVTPLRIAARHKSNKSIEIVKTLVKKGGYINNTLDFDRFGDVKNNISTSPLFDAIEEGDLEMVKFLVDECEAKVNVVNEDSNSPLFVACRTNDIEKVKFLVQRGANLDPVRDDEVSCLFSRGGDDGEIAMNPDILKFLLREGIDLNVPYEQGGNVPLFYIRMGETENLKILLEERDIDVDEKIYNDLNTYSLLFWTVYYDHWNQTKLLLEYGADYSDLAGALESSGHKNILEELENLIVEVSNDKVKGYGYV